MRRDLEGLEISKGELRRLCGVATDDLIRSSILQDREKKSSFFYKELLVNGSLTVIVFFASLTLADIITWHLKGMTIDLAFPNTSPWAIFITLGLGAAVLSFFVRLLWLQNNTYHSKSLLGILDDIDNYNDLIRAIDLNDQLEDVGNPEVTLTNRSEVIAALKITRRHLISALKTERILRENKTFIERNPELFASNLTALEALQVTDKASERGRLLDEALQIALSTQGEIQKLHQHRPRY
ncbi:hypothetical protein [Oxynema aestuarii]|uniref:Uncharacterized protein n=1 Tax=Oxynema aestuarii AP17 TaxID=2064643 RepID=A0A6H1U0T2_9CYAN|nr:hypothetical protein [Oxynema aestuarii]QIZ71770.1 hypothetical protein HCG48_15210 [Oxynema aestuarii AP17]